MGCLWIKRTAGVFLAVFLIACGQPEYSLRGHAEIRSVVLLNRSAHAIVDSIQADYARLSDLLVQAEKSAVDSMQQHASSLGPSIRRAQNELREANERYAQTFKETVRFRSFGGNPIFSEEDANISTDKLLSEISGRFYKGRAFSLETEGQMRRFIREKLVPIEKIAQDARYRLTRLRRSQTGRQNATGDIEAEYEIKRANLLLNTNIEISQALETVMLAEAKVDSSGQFAFDGIGSGAYFLFGGQADSLDYIVPVRVTSHVYQALVPEAGLPILVANASRDNSSP